MLDIIKEGIKHGQSLALLPLKAARKLVDDKNTGAKQMIDLAEDFISIPFVAATRTIDKTSKCSVRETDCGRSGSAGGGPTFRNIWVNPEVTVFSDVEVKPGKRRAILTVEGLLCGG